ncbi:DoxX family protein [Haladaptatus caseinilyticus]|uniref:DoxX family protein n=1 Tax=Haladaptatus caseinilyticus TaxID=2993314 RepID=UPI00224B5CC6|nr:DoxX family protein [Haladaptatus caseinilyticus]
MTANVLSRTRRTIGASKRNGEVLGYTLWFVQGVLALLFLYTGGTKLILPLSLLTAQTPVPLPGLFIRFLGIVEVLGAIGLILPGLLHIRVGLTPLAAAGLVLIMAGATVLTLVSGGGAMALFPFVVGSLATFVAYGRWRLRPLSN